jgi:hypothetical protein
MGELVVRSMLPILGVEAVFDAVTERAERREAIGGGCSGGPIATSSGAVLG